MSKQPQYDGIKVPMELANQLVTYLNTKAYQEVSPLIAKLQQCEPYPLPEQPKMEVKKGKATANEEAE